MLGAALYNAELELLVAIPCLRLKKGLPASQRPTMGEVHRGFRVVEFTWVGWALVEHHHDVGSQSPLDINHILGRKQVR